MSHCGGQTITVTATNHYAHFTRLPYATHHETHSLSLNPFIRAKQTDIWKNPKAVESLGLETCLLWKVGEEWKKKKSILKTMTARKKKLLQREGLGQLPIHTVCAFAIARLNQYVSNSAWNTISPCLKKKMKNTEGRLKTSPMFPSKAFTLNTYTAFQTHDSLLCAAPVEESKQRGKHAFVWIYKRCLNVSAKLIPLYCVGSWRYQATTSFQMHLATNLLWPAWPSPTHSLCSKEISWVG